MATISINDILFASAVHQGRCVANVRMRGVDSTRSVLSELRRIVGNTIGLVQVTLRNVSQGWSRNITLYMESAPLREGVQLSLF